MKKTLLILISIFTIGTITAQQCNVVVFSSEGERFKLVVNGILQSNEFETNVKVTDLMAGGQYKFKVLFENSANADLDKNVFTQEPNMESTYQIKKNRKGEYVMRLMSMVAIPQAPIAPAQAVVVYSTTPPAPPAPVETTMTVTESTTTTTTTNGTGTTEQVNMSAGMGGVDFNVNVNVSDNGMGMSTGTNVSETTTSTTVTTTTTSTGMNMNSTNPVHPGIPVEEPVESHYHMPGYSGPVGCPWPMNASDYNAAKNSIDSKSFDDSKMTMAKQITRSNCLTSAQVSGIMKSLDFEDSRLEYAKFAYDYTFDIGNYFKVNDAFQFESSIEELDEYISTK